MKILLLLSDCIIPLIVFGIVLYGLYRKRPVYDDFVDGAKNGMKTVAGILPTLVGLMIGVGAMRSCGFLDAITALVSPLSQQTAFPAELVPLTIVRMFSTSAATGLSLDIFSKYGTDSFIGLATSILMSCTETIFYTMSVYFITAGVKKTRWTLAGALICTFAGIVASMFLASMLG